MWRLAAAFVEIALHSRGPESLPASPLFFRIVLAAYLLAGATLLSSAGALDTTAALLFVFNCGLYLGYIWLILEVVKFRSRFVQTATALLGVDTFFNLLGIPIAAWTAAAQAAESLATFPALLTVALFLWSIDVAAFVLARALDRPYMTGLLIVIPYIMVSIFVQSAFSAASAMPG